MSSRVVLWLLLLTFSGLGNAIAAPAKVVLTNGVITTLDSTNRAARALAYDANGQIIAIGSTVQVLGAAGVGARIIDLNGAQVLPGFHDVHLHALEAGINENRCLLSEFGDVADYQREISQCAAMQKSQPWFLGAGVSMPDLLSITNKPIELLDQLVPDKPALILDNLGHGAWANSRAFAAVGFDAIGPNPAGGLIDRLPDSTLSGVVYENAQQALRTAALGPSATNLAANYEDCYGR